MKYEGDTAVADFRDTSGDSTDLALSEAYRSLDDGDSQRARGLAQSALIAAKANSNRLLEAHALSCLAHCDRVTQRLRRASDTSRRAAQLFQRLGEPGGETSALNTLAHACMLLGRNDEAVEAALLSVRLCDVQVSTEQAVLAHNCLGLAYCWSGNFDKANDSLETSVALAARCTPAMSPYQPKLNQLWVEAARLANERYQTGAMSSLKRMGTLVRECRRLERSGEELRFAPGMLPTARTISVVMKGLYSSWQGEVDNAQIYSERAIGSLGGTVTWLDALVRWSLAGDGPRVSRFVLLRHGDAVARVSGTAHATRYAALADAFAVAISTFKFAAPRPVSFLEPYDWASSIGAIPLGFRRPLSWRFEERGDTPWGRQQLDLRLVEGGGPVACLRARSIDRDVAGDLDLEALAAETLDELRALGFASSALRNRLAPPSPGDPFEEKTHGLVFEGRAFGRPAEARVICLRSHRALYALAAILPARDTDRLAWMGAKRVLEVAYQTLNRPDDDVLAPPGGRRPKQAAPEVPALDDDTDGPRGGDAGAEDATEHEGPAGEEE